MRRFLPALLLLITACDSGGDLSEPEESTWQTIQARILEPNCTEACHSAGTSVAAQSGLVLTADVAYEQLVGTEPTNPSARRNGLLRVHSAASRDLHRSYLWEKINAPEQDHLYEEHPDYGAIMPLGGQPLTYGELSLIRRWILAGAPDEGVVADPIILQDTARYRATSFEELPMLAPDEGISIRLGPFEVPPQFEREFFFREPLEVSQTRLIKRSTISMAPGSHHFIVYTFSPDTPASELPLTGVIRDLRRPDGTLATSVLRQMARHVFFSGTQWPRMDYRFPPGVALELEAGSVLDLNPHYVNRTGQVTHGEVHLNLEFADPGAVQHVARVLNLNNTEFVLPPRQVTTVEKTYLADERMHVFQLFSHAHQHMLDFRVEIAGGPRDGETVYIATDWEHPPILEVDPPITLEAGQGFRLLATYDNWTDHPLTFGFKSTDEMMILFGYYHTDSGKRGPRSGGPMYTGGGEGDTKATAASTSKSAVEEVRRGRGREYNLGTFLYSLASMGGSGVQ